MKTDVSAVSFTTALEEVTSGSASSEHIRRLLSAGGDEVRALFQAADLRRRTAVGDDVHLRAIVEFSSHCARNCSYCGLRAGNRQLMRYRMTPEEILATAQGAEQVGYRTVVLQSGEDMGFSIATLCDVVCEIRRRTNLAVTVSVGERPFREYALLRQAGAQRYLLKHETADPRLYARLHIGHRLADRIAALQSLRDLGFQIGSGFMVGLPGQSVDVLVADLQLLQRLDVDMAGIGPFIAHPDTPLGRAQSGDARMTLKCVAVARLLLPNAHVPATTALGTIAGDGWAAALQVGANVVMPNLTPEAYRSSYAIYPGKGRDREEPREQRAQVERMVTALGRTVAQDAGHSLRWIQKSKEVLCDAYGSSGMGVR
ncbi:MAG: [FeFe] hydrogenase H-cluster radical SAM maturase HydE [Limnochordia bacterium]|jgi:biotin synthase